MSLLIPVFFWSLKTAELHLVDHLPFLNLVNAWASFYFLRDSGLLNFYRIVCTYIGNSSPYVICFKLILGEIYPTAEWRKDQFSYKAVEPCFTPFFFQYSVPLTQNQ